MELLKFVMRYYIGMMYLLIRACVLSAKISDIQQVTVSQKWTFVENAQVPTVLMNAIQIPCLV